MKRPSHRPPRLAAALLNWLLADAWHTPLGDFEEYYHDLAQQHGERRARWWYRGQVALLIPDRVPEKVFWKIVMLKNYFILAYRNLLKNKVASGINIFGLSMAVGCSIAVFLMLQNYWTLDNFHANGERIYLVNHTVERDGQVQSWGTAPVPLGPMMEADLPQVEQAVRFQYGSGTVQYGDIYFDELLMFADPSLLEMFTFPLKYGNPEALQERNTVILNQAIATKYFGEANPVGEQLTIALGSGEVQGFTVQGVAEPFPQNSGFYFDVLLNYDKRLDLGLANFDDWSDRTRGLFVLLDRPDNAEVVEQQMQRYVALQNAADEDWVVQSFFLDNLVEPAPNAYRTFYRAAETRHPAMVLMFLAIAGVMMALSCFNYVNIALGTASRRLKEIGVRKAMGGNRGQLIGQFMAENFLLCLLALLLGVALTQWALIPAFNERFVMKISLAFSENLGLWVFLTGLLAFTAFISGAYPAFYISSFQPVSIFQGKQRFAGKKWYTKAFLTVQFTLAAFAVMVGVVMTMNGRYVAQQHWGYAPDHTVVVRLQESKQFPLLRDALLQNPNVVTLAGANTHVGEGVMQARVEVHDAITEVVRFYVGPSYFESLGLQLRAGRFFDERFTSDASEAVVVSAAFVEAQSWENGLGEQIRMGENTYTIVGVIEDFKFHPAMRIQPLVFVQTDPSVYNYLTVRVQPGKNEHVAASIEQSWKQLFPDSPYHSYFQADVFDRFFSSYGRVAKGMSYLAGLALLIACMGLFGLVAQNIARRMKEISIRKVVGASVAHLIVLVNRGFLVLLLIACGIASAVGATAMHFGLQMIEEIDLMPLNPWPFILSTIILLATATLAIVMHAQKVVRANPADVLRNE